MRTPIIRISLLIISLLLLMTGCANKKNDSSENLAQQQVETLYNKGKLAMDKGNYTFALKYFRALEANYPYGKHTEQAKLDMIFALYKSNQIEQAVDVADNFIKLYPTHKNVDYAYYMKGVANFEKKQSSFEKFIKGGKRSLRDPQPLRDSEAAFDQLIKRYPLSKYAEDAKQRIVYIHNTLAERELKIAEYYYNDESYVATLNRCKNIIYQYETTPIVKDALILMEKTYQQMGLSDLTNSTHQVLQENFPDTAAEKAPQSTKKISFLRRLNPFKK